MNFTPTMVCPTSRVILALVLVLAFFVASDSHAHQVPSLTLEAEFDAKGAASFSLNLDPRLFLAEDPTTLPPIPAPWFRDQNEQDRTQTLANALAYVQNALTFFFDEQQAAALVWEFEPIDGATGGPFTDATAEIHFLAKCKAQLPANTATSSVRLEPNAKAAAVLLNHLDQAVTKTRPQILFPGERSRPFRCVPTENPAPPAATETKNP